MPSEGRLPEEVELGAGEFCAICGLFESEHPQGPPPGPPTPPPERHEGIWRPPHAFKPSGITFAEVLDERDAVIHIWRSRAYIAHGAIKRIGDEVDRFRRAESSTEREQ